MKEIVEASASMLGKKNVVGMAVGIKHTGGMPTGEDAIIFMVEKKESSGLSDRDKVPETMDGYKTDVFGVGKIITEIHRVP